MRQPAEGITTLPLTWREERPLRSARLAGFGEGVDGSRWLIGETRRWSRRRSVVLRGSGTQWVLALEVDRPLTAICATPDASVIAAGERLTAHFDGYQWVQRDAPTTFPKSGVLLETAPTVSPTRACFTSMGPIGRTSTWRRLVSPAFGPTGPLEPTGLAGSSAPTLLTRAWLRARTLNGEATAAARGTCIVSTSDRMSRPPPGAMDCGNVPAMVGNR